MEKLWHVQRLEDGTYGDWREFKENKEGIIFMGDKIIGWDYGTEDYNCMVYGHFNEGGEYVIDRVGYNKKGGKKLNNKKDFNKMCEVNYNKMIKKLMKDPLIKKIVEKLNEKEVKKMKYFETKVVKVKKEIERKQGECKEYVPLWCGECSRIPKQKKGNWVNGENLDKIKFPCFCSYVWIKRQYGILAAGVPIDKREYLLHDINEQDSCSTIDRSDSLKKLIEKYDIHILKGKVIIYDDDMEDKYSDD